MGINIISRAMITMFVIGFIYLAFMPIMNMITQNGGLFPNVVLDDRALFIQENLYMIYQASGVIYIVGCIVWMFNASDRKSVSRGY